MQNKNVDQSQFIKSQSDLQAPPEELERAAYLQANQVVIQKKRKKMFLALGGAVVVLTTLAMLIFRPAPEQTPIIFPTPTPTPVVSTRLDAEMERLKIVVDQADPRTKPLAPPPVDMKVNF